MILGTLGTSLLENILTGRGINRDGEGIIRAENGTATKKSKANELKEQVRKAKLIFNAITSFNQF